MKSLSLAVVVAALSLGACSRPLDVSGGGGGEAHGRYASAGIYPAGRMWAQLAGAPAPKDASAAKLIDDQQIIVVLDSQTGELRQCGNISGYCVGMSPWAQPVGASVPLAVDEHADQIDAEAKAQFDKAAKAH